MTDEVFIGDINTFTLADAKDWLRIRAKKGARCPCCKQYVKIYKRPLGSQMARWLIWLVRTWDQQFAGERDRLREPEDAAWVDIRQSPVRGGDYAKLLHWGLVQQKSNMFHHAADVKKDNGAKDTRDSGLWRPTFAGVDFVYGRRQEPSHVYLYDNIKLRAQDKLKDITIQEALGKKYSYQELMNAPIHVEVPV